jgi:hypothetical protein
MFENGEGKEMKNGNKEFEQDIKIFVQNFEI